MSDTNTNTNNTNNALVVISNHPVDNWSAEQKKGWDKIIYVPFPNVPPEADEVEVRDMAADLLQKNEEDIVASGNVSIQGEFSFTITFIDMVRKQYGTKISFWVPTTKRVVLEKVTPSGETKKESIFSFVRWRLVV